MSSEEDVGVVEVGELCDIYYSKAFGLQAVDFLAVVDDVADAVEGVAAVEAFLEGGDGASDAEAEA